MIQLVHVITHIMRHFFGSDLHRVGCNAVFFAGSNARLSRLRVCVCGDIIENNGSSDGSKQELAHKHENSFSARSVLILAIRPASV